MRATSATSRALLALLLLVSACAAPRPADHGAPPARAWVSIGPGPPAIEAPIAVHPASHTIYIAAFGGGVLRSRDDGKTFVRIHRGLPNGQAITAMTIDPSDPKRLTLGTFGRGIFRTVDGGESWASSSESSGIVCTLSTDPTRPRVLYAGYNGPILIQRSDDGGASWRPAAQGLPSNETTSVWSIVVDPRRPDTVFVGTGGGGAWRSRDGGKSWSALPLGTTVWSFALDPEDPRVVYAATNDDGVWKSEDGGDHFARLSRPSDGAVVSLAVDPTDRRRIYAGTVTAGLTMSTDGGRTWSRVALEGSIVLSLTMSASGRLFVGTSFAGAHVRAAADGPLAPLAEGELGRLKAQSIYAIVLDPRDPRRLILGTNDGGLIGSDDGGDRWRSIGEAFPNRAPRKAAFDPRDPRRVYVGPFVGGGLYASLDGGRTWREHAIGETGAGAWASVVDPRSGAIWVGTSEEGLWRRDEGAPRFVRVDGGRIRGNIRDLVLDPRRPGALFVASTSGLWRTLDGERFDEVLAVPTFSLALDPATPEVVYAATRKDGVWKSTDGGASFTRASTGLRELRTSRGGGIVVDPVDPRVLYVGTEGGGVWRSDDAGASWSAASPGLEDPMVYSLVMDPTHPRTLYAGGPSGIWKTVTGGR